MFLDLNVIIIQTVSYGFDQYDHNKIVSSKLLNALKS